MKIQQRTNPSWALKYSQSTPKTHSFDGGMIYSSKAMQSMCYRSCITFSCSGAGSQPAFGYRATSKRCGSKRTNLQTVELTGLCSFTLATNDLDQFLTFHAYIGLTCFNFGIIVELPPSFHCMLMLGVRNFWIVLLIHLFRIPSLQEHKLGVN
ncbi:hypothetical protein EYC84_004154 [Monilinia fructicola]|uniref:Uncharacterized protein n=1 Tax=Monilinia fructicola TaxID=38448 RepID=A0A5M9K268_MONFR|nr:hypothetical protein EYC84_004154 [Monilinia fructicola]